MINFHQNHFSRLTALLRCCKHVRDLCKESRGRPGSALFWLVVNPQKVKKHYFQLKPKNLWGINRRLCITYTVSAAHAFKTFMNRVLEPRGILVGPRWPKSATSLDITMISCDTYACDKNMIKLVQKASFENWQTQKGSKKRSSIHQKYSKMGFF